MIKGDFEQQSLYDVEVSVRKASGGEFVGEVRLPAYTDQISCRLSEIPAEFQDPDFRRKMPPRDYGGILFQWLFGGELGSALQGVQELVDAPLESSIENVSVGVRFRLFLDEPDALVSRLPWEALWNPHHDYPLTLLTAFSRFIRVKASRRWPMVEQPLQMHLIVSSPEGLGRLDLSQIDDHLVHNTVKRAMTRLGPLLNVHRLSGEPTLDNIAAFSSTEHQILHVLAHSVVDSDGRGQLVLADPTGKAVQVNFHQIAQAIASRGGTINPPQLVFLGTPLSEEDEAKAVFLDLAPLLVNGGVQAVVAVQGSMNADQLLLFTERFYDVLVRTGVVDVAMTEARKTLFERDPNVHAWASPVLFSRVPDNRLFQPVSAATHSKIASIGVTY